MFWTEYLKDLIHPEACIKLGPDGTFTVDLTGQQELWHRLS